MQEIERSTDQGIPMMVVTANPEIVLEASKNPGYWNALRQADVRLVDGFGLQCAGWFAGAAPVRVTGVEFAERLLQYAVVHDRKVALIGGEDGVAESAAWNMRKAYPSIRLVAEQGGIVTHDGIDDEAGEEARFRLTAEAPDILFVAFGHPKQERWIVNHLAEFPSVKIVVGIGGTLDYWSQRIQRAPRWMRFLGLEWLWRFVLEPKRWKRIWNAVFVFPVRVCIERFHLPASSHTEK